MQAVTSKPTRGMLLPTAEDFVPLTGLLVGAVAVNACGSVIRSIALCPLIVAHPIYMHKLANHPTMSYEVMTAVLPLQLVIVVECGF